MTDATLTPAPTSPAQVTGHTKPKAGRVLQRLASRIIPPLCIVEVGVFMGRSTCYLGTGARDGQGAHVTAVDPWDLPGDRYPYAWREERPSRHRFTQPETREAAEAAVTALGLDDTVTLVRGFSREVGQAWDGPNIGLLHIDGDHTLDAVRWDWWAWRDHVPPGGFVAWDDHVPTCADVMTAVAEFVAVGDLTPPKMATRRLAITRRL